MEQACSMAQHTTSFVPRHSSLKVVPYSSSPDKYIKGYAQAPVANRAGQLAAASHSRQHLNSSTSRSLKATAALPDNAAAVSSAQGSATAADADPEAVRLMTAAAILSASEDSADGAADCSADFDEDGSAPPLVSGPLSVLDELQVLDADSLSLVVGILRQHQPLEADEGDVQLSERLRDLLLLLRQRPASPVASLHSSSSRSSMSRSASPAFGSDLAGPDGLDNFWAGADEWSDVRAALMSIGINASVDEESDEDVWTMEEEGPARRTHLLKSLPRLNADTSAELASFLADVQQRTGAHAGSGRANGGSSSGRGGSNGKTAAADQAAVGIEEEERWWDEVTQAYQLLWQQARLQQAKQAE